MKRTSGGQLSREAKATLLSSHAGGPRTAAGDTSFAGQARAVDAEVESQPAAKPEDPPITQFEAKIPALGPQEIKDVSATASTKLRIYEMPDWQFIRAEAEITSPAP